MNFLFDIDGTLTPSRERIVDSFEIFFVRFIQARKSQGDNIILVTGSDKDKTIEQIGLPLWRMVDYCFQNCGNQIYQKGNLIRESEWQQPEGLIQSVKNIIRRSCWFGTAGNNIEHRQGMINISTVGRDCTKEERTEYYEWDKVNEERKHIVNLLKSKYDNLDLAIGGEISIDIYEKGKDKAQAIEAIRDFGLLGKNIFFGDRCEEGGNDHSIALASDEFHNVKDWNDTQRILDIFLKL